MKLMEYMIMRKPVVASKTKTSSYYFDESMVVFFDPGNEHSLAEAVIRLCEDSNKRKRLVENSIKFLRKHNWAAYKKAYLNLVEQLCNQNQDIT